MLLYLHLPDVKIEIPIKTKEKIISTTTTGRTTKQPYDNHKVSDSEQESDNWKVGVSVGIVLFVLFTAIGKSLILINCPLNYIWVLKTFENLNIKFCEDAKASILSW